MHVVAVVILIIAATAWLAPAIRAFKNGKPQLGALALATGPIAIGLYLLDRHPNVFTGAFVALIIGGAILWRRAAK